MQRWEYLMVDVNEGVVRWVNGREVAKVGLFTGTKGQSFLDFLPQAGQEGWELVTITESGPEYAGPRYDRMRNFIAVFKRPQS